MVRWLFVILALIGGCESVNRQRLVDLANKYEAEIREQKSDAGLDVLLAKLSDGKTWKYNKLDTLAVVKSSDMQGDYDVLASRMEQGIRLPQIWYDVKCRSCGSEFQSTEEGDLDSCINCPFDICDETSVAIMMIGTIQEIVRAQPENTKAKERLDECLSIFNKHLEGCEKCRKALEKHTSRKSSKPSVARSTPISK